MGNDISNKSEYILEHLDQALEENWIQVYFQPIVRSTNTLVCDEEALARWIDPIHGFMSPADFIPVLEEARLLYKLDLHILDQVILKMKRVSDSGNYIIPCSINLSRYDFECCDMVEEIHRRVYDAGIDPDRLSIEITESAVGADMEHIAAEANRLHDLGFEIWMDDYGSGYSSPDVLIEAPFSTIKLDMVFMRQFDKNEKSRIIINQIIRMAINLGLETVVEGVETQEQVDFLLEAGATKMQGFFFCKPISQDDLFDRYENGLQIGIENPKTSDYYAAVGRVNLVDISVSVDESDKLSSAYKSMPMAVMEVSGHDLSLMRFNRAALEVGARLFPGVDVDSLKERIPLETVRGDVSKIVRGIYHCAGDGRQVILDERNMDSYIAHVLIRRVSINPVTCNCAVSVVVLGVEEDRIHASSLTFGRVAQALSSDYVNLYYVNIEDERYYSYTPNSAGTDMMVQDVGINFFESVKRDVKDVIYEPDQEKLLTGFTRENVLGSIDRDGTYTLTYRLLIDDEPTYVSMKATYIGNDNKHIIIGVNNVDAQMRHQEMMQRLRDEQAAYARISALTGNFFAFFTVDPKTDHYIEFNTTTEYEDLGIAKEGEDFFNTSLENGLKIIYPDDKDLYIKGFTKKKVMKGIKEKGIYSLDYRMELGGEVRKVSLRAAKFTEDGKEMLIFGICNI